MKKLSDLMACYGNMQEDAAENDKLIQINELTAGTTKSPMQCS
jgi:hypothetical protein